MTEARARASSRAIASPMPRDPPVTSAVLPASEQNSRSATSTFPTGSCSALDSEGLLELGEPGEVVHRDRLNALVDPLHEAREHGARSHLDERLHALVDELLRRLRELHRRG